MNDAKKIKVLYVITKGNWGGAQRYVFDLATNLPKSHFETAVAAGEGTMLKDALREEGVRVIELKPLARDMGFRRDLDAFVGLVRLFKAEKPGVLHLNSSKAAGLGVLAARVAKIPCIMVTIHGLPQNEPRQFLIRLLIKLATYATVLLSHKTILISTRDKESFPRFPGIAKKLHLVLIGIKGSRTKSAEEARGDIFANLKKPTELCAGKTIIGTVAELTRNKGLSFAVEAMRDIPEALYIIVGGGEERANLERLIAERGLTDRVFLCGFMPDAKNLLKAFNIFLLPSLKEGLPYTLLEAGLVSRPVVASYVGGTPDIIEDMKTGILVKPAQPKEISKALLFLIEHPDKQKEFGSALAKDVREKFAFHEFLEKTYALYEKTSPVDTSEPLQVDATSL